MVQGEHALAWIAGARSRTLNSHNLNLGQIVEPLSVNCGIKTQIVSDTAATQLVTFATFKDCSSCETHIGGLEDISAKGGIGIPNMLVVWPEPGTMSGDVANTRHRSHREVCTDENGDMWDRFNLQHTPVTVVLKKGKIVYLHDRPLTSAADQNSFLVDLRRYIDNNPAGKAK